MWKRWVYLKCSNDANTYIDFDNKIFSKYYPIIQVIIEVYDHLDKCQSGGSSICKNGGTCVIKEDGKIECLCLNEFSGSFCEQGIIATWWKLKQYT